MTAPRPTDERQARARAFADEWIAAWNAHDLDRIVAHYADPLELCSPLVERRLPALGGTIRDRATLREYFAVGLASQPSLSFELIEVLCGVRGFCMYYRNARGGHTAEYVELDDDGKAVKVIVCYS